MTKLIFFDIAAVFVLLPIIPAMIRKYMNNGTVNRWFFAFIGIQIFTAISDVIAVELDILGPGNVALKYIAHTAYLVGRSFVAPMGVAFLLARVGFWYRFKNYYRAVLVYFSAALIPSVLLLFVNPFYHVMFYLAEGDVYTRGALMTVMYVVSFLYAIPGYYTLAHYVNVLGRRKVTYITIVFSLALLATAFQFFYPAIIIENFMMSIASLIIALGIQAPEERLYGRTAFYKTSAFTEDMAMSRVMDIPVNLIIIAVSNFDTIKEMIGYDAIVRSIEYISSRLDGIRKMAKTDIDFYYLGSGEFVCTLINDKNNKVLEAAHNINELLQKDFSVGEINVKFLSNICVAYYPKDISNAADIIPFTERLKHYDYTGEVRYAEKIFSKREYDIRRNIDEVIDRAITDGTLTLVYQPVYSVEKERYIAIEAFLRVRDPFYGDIEPEIFIKEAERSGAIHGITTYLFEEICKFISGPEFMQLNIKWIELNLSPIQCMWTDLVSVVTSLISSYDIDPSKVCFNIVDDENVQYFSKMYENLEALHKAGITLYMDDFGAGVFEIERIAKLPLNGIKLDRQFVKMGVETDSVLILKNSVNMIKDMGLDVVAVGVENLSLRRRLVEMGCVHQQGYYYTAPKDKRELIRFMVGLPGVMR